MRNFCYECGSSLFATTALNDQIISISAGSLDAVSDWEPTKELYCKNKAEWTTFSPSRKVEQRLADPFSPAP
jgi:hypothetical protein